MISEDAEESSALFTATFMEGRVECMVLADIGADDNIIPTELLTELLKQESELKVENLSPPKVFKSAVKDTIDGGSAKINCSKKVQLDVKLNIRHGSYLLLRNVVWLVSDKDADCAYLGRPLLEHLGLDAGNYWMQHGRKMTELWMQEI